MDRKSFEPIEPFRIKMVEALKKTSRSEREQYLREAGFNLFNIRAEDVYVDLLTDSGTGAMSDRQWAGMMMGDESYAGGRNFLHFEETVRRITGFRNVIPTHQGRVAENLLFTNFMKPGQTVPNNSHFDTTRANVESKGGIALDLLRDEAADTQYVTDFKGDMDPDKLRRLISELGPEKIPLGMLTVTNNSAGGQPVSMDNIETVSEILHAEGIPFFLDACRFAENAWFIKERDPRYASWSVPDIARKMFSYADGCTMSAKKDAIVNIGGFIALNDDAWAATLKNNLIMIEGFPTYGGLAGRDLEAVAIGLQEGMDADYLAYRTGQTRALAGLLEEFGVPVVKPAGGHAVFVDAGRFLPHIPSSEFPAQALAAELYIEGGIRGVEVGSLMFGRTDGEGQFVPAANELLRLAIPRRVYTWLHLKFVAEAFLRIAERKDSIRGLKILEEPPHLRHFSARMATLA